MRFEKAYRRGLRAISHFLIFFLLVAFLITCCLMLFVTLMGDSMDLVFTAENITLAAKLTFFNVLLLSFGFTAFDAVRRKLTIDRPVKRITEATRKLMQGDFSARIELGYNTDNERFREIAECFNQMAEELSGIETLRTDFVANVSHELKTPLAVMQNYGTMLQLPELPEEKRLEYAKAVSATSRRLADLISNILKLNKLENQQIFPTASVYDLGEQLCTCMLNFESVWEEKSLVIDTEIQEGVLVQADADMMSLVWNNLLSNALKFTEPGGTVSLRLVTRNGKAVVQIEDTGCGISPEVGQHIFDKFYQGDTSHATQGNGLGLALVKRIIDITGSEIMVESEAGRGSTFTVKLQECDGNEEISD